jgi:hypothetical protein
LIKDYDLGINYHHGDSNQYNITMQGINLAT